MKIVIIDNYDSFTFNLVHLVRELGCSPCVLRNDRFDPESLADFDKILLSPGPGIPSEAALMPEVIRRYAASKPILGVCLGDSPWDATTPGWWTPPRCPPAWRPPP